MASHATIITGATVINADGRQQADIGIIDGRISAIAAPARSHPRAR